MLETFTGQIFRMFNNCPKPNDWFGCFFKLSNSRIIRLTGVYHGVLDTSTKYHIIVEPTSNNDEYVLKQLIPIVKADKSVIKYLSSSMFVGVGEKTAEKIYNKYGEDTLYVIEYESDKLKTLNISDKLINVLRNGVSSNSVLNQLKKLCPMLSEHIIANIIDCYEDKAVDIVKTNPYDMLYTVDGLSFSVVDKLALSLGIKSNDVNRLEQCLRYAVHTALDNTGCVYWDLSDNNSYNYLVQIFKSYINDMSVTVTDMYNIIAHVGDIVGLYLDTVDGYKLYEQTGYNAECNVAQSIKRMLTKKSVYKAILHIDSYIADYEADTGLTLDDSQKNAVKMVLTNRVSILNGKPGHGKTFVVDCVLYCWDKVMSKAPILATSTGMSARKLALAINNKYDVVTIDRHIAMVKHAKNKNDVLKQYVDTLIVVDECSLIGLIKSNDMMNLFSRGQILFVGDFNQLLPIENGQFFKDVCCCDIIPKTTLDINHRSKDVQTIGCNADFIMQGVTSDGLSYDSKAFVFDKCDTGFDYSDYVISNYMYYVGYHNYDINEDKARNVCILCPTSKTNTGSKMINLRIQNKINPLELNATTNMNGYEISRSFYGISKDNYTRLRVGDRVMYTKNRYDITWYMSDANAGYGIFNGDCGFIREYVPATDDTEGYTIVELDDGRFCEIPDEHISELILAYAISVHKSQGNEYDVVIYSAQDLLLYTQGDFASRNLLYTAITRAKSKVHIIGSSKSVDKCISTMPYARNSYLIQRIERG